MAKKAKKKVAKKSAKRAKKVRVKSASTVTKKRVKRAKKTRVKSSSTTTHKKRSKTRKKTGKKRTSRKYANKEGRAWKAYMAKESQVARPQSGPMTPAQAKAAENFQKKLAAANAAFGKAESLLKKARLKKPSKTKKKASKKRTVRKYANKTGKAWKKFMAIESRAKRPMQGPVQRKTTPGSTRRGKRVSKPKEKTVTAASILKGVKSFKTKAWLCAGPKRTGCGGGKKGGHVLATLF